MAENLFKKIIQVDSGMIDGNGHVNNVVYVDSASGRPKRIPKLMKEFVWNLSE